MKDYAEPKVSFQEIVARIEERMPLEEFLQIHYRIMELRKEEEAKLNALAEIQKVYLSATTDEEKELVRQTVADIRELSRKARLEIRSLNTRILASMSMDESNDLFARYEAAKKEHPAG